MANGVKTYQIKINGVTESIDAVKSLNEQLKSLEARIKALEGKSVGVKTSYSGGGSKSSSTSALSEEEKLAKQIEQIDEKRVAYSKEIYQSYLAAKDVLKETVKDQNAIAATERLQAKAYSNTMMGMKQELADIKAAMQTVDLGDTGQMDKMAQRANELNEALKKIEESYGQFGRNVGNYASAFDGLQKISITVGGVVREFNSAREASKTLKNELIGLEAAGEGDSEMAKQLRTELYKLQSAMDDATKSSKVMDEAMDFMQSFTAMASIGQGLKGFFGIDDSEIQRSIQKLVALQNVLQGIEKLRKQMETGEGFGKLFANGSKEIDTFVSKITGAQVTMNGLEMSSRTATLAVRGFSMALKGIGIGFIIEAISLAVEGIQTFIKSLDTTKIKEAAVEREAKSLNRAYETRKELLAGQYMSGVITNEQYLAEQYKLENEYLDEQITLLQQRASLANNRSWFKDFFMPGEDNGFTGQKFNGSATSSSWNAVGVFSYDVKSVEEAEEAWKKLNEAVIKGNDYFTEYGKGLGDWFSSLRTTVQETEDVMKGMGNIVLSNTIGEFQELEQKFKDGNISADEFAEGLKVLTERMNSNEVLNSVIANLDKYIPDDEVREKVQNIIDYIRQLNNEFNAVSEAQIHHWNQVKIDAMEEGAAKIAAQMAEDERHEIAQYGKTQEQITLIQKKYQRKRLDEQKKHNKKVSSEAKKNAREQLEAERDLANLRVANMKEGLNKILKQLEEERKQRLAKVEADGRLVAERQAEINILYDKKILDAKKDWAEKVQKAYRDMWDNIYNYSLETTRKVAELMEQSIDVGRQNWDYGKDEKFGGNWSKLPDYGVQGVSQLSESTQKDLQIEQAQNKKLAEIFEERNKIVTKYWEERKEFELSAITATYQSQVLLENETYQKEMRDAAAHAEDLNKQNEKNLKDGLITQEKYDEILERTIVDHQNRVEAITSQHNVNLQKLEQERVNKIRNVEMESFRQRLQELRDFQTAIANLESKQPVYNIFGTTNFKQTNANYRILLESYKEQADEIVKLKKDLQDKLDKKQITFDDFQNANRELDTFVDNLGQKMDEVKYKLSIGGQIQQFVQDMQVYIQAVSQSLTQIMQAVWDAQDVAFDKEQDEIDKALEKIQKALDEEEEIVNQHKDKINAAEEELATARGERRQHLIDQINAEMEAARASARQAQKLREDEERQNKKAEELEKKRKKAQYKRDLAQAVVNGAMAVTMAAINNWPMPAIAMMALAAATTAAQIATITSNKPYAKGGVLEGPSHSQGGIPVGNTGIEVEGKEYVVRKRSTTPNVQLLDMINKSERKLTLDDFIDFYSTGKIKKNIKSISPQAKFASGGVIPTISNAYDFDDRLISAFEDYSNRPVYVAVTDINNKQEQVRNVQVLAGLE